MSTFTNTDSTIDSRDIIERIEELENNGCDFDEHEELETLKALAEECEDYAPDWTYGTTLIHRDHFKQYMDEFIQDCYEIPKDLPSFMIITVDYVALEEDYTSVDFDGQEYLIR